MTSRFEELTVKNGSIKIRDILSNNLRMTTGKSNVKSINKQNIDSFFLKVKEMFPNLQISVPVLCENWDTENFIPLVAFIPVDYDEKTHKEVTAYDINGKEYILSTLEEPNYPVIVVGISERVDINGNMYDYSETVTQTQDKYKIIPGTPASISLRHGIANTLILEWSDVLDDNGYEIWRMSNNSNFVLIATTTINDNNYLDANLVGGTKYWYKVRSINNDGYSAWSQIITTTASPRNEGELLKIQRMKFTTNALQAVESWISGAPELRLRVVKGSESGASFVFTSGMIEPNHRDDIRDKWWYFNVTVCDWYTSVFGTVLNFDWREEDSKFIYEFNVTGSYEDKKDNGSIKAGGSLNIKSNPGADCVGNTTVFWWDPRNKIYDITGFNWDFVQ